jgi:hypothetical protein
MNNMGKILQTLQNRTVEMNTSNQTLNNIDMAVKALKQCYPNKKGIIAGDVASVGNANSNPNIK